MSMLAAELDEYLAVRRRGGFVIGHDADTLRSFLRFCDARQITTITTAAIVEWATTPVGVSPAWTAQRFGVVRRFAVYTQFTNPAHEVPPERLIVGTATRVVPFLYSDRDVTAIIDAATRLSGRVRPHSYATLIGLLAATGMRISEALALDDTDIDLDSGVIVVRNSKFGKSRRLLVQPTTSTALTSYRCRRDEIIPTVSRNDRALFITDHAQRVAYRQCQATFRRCVTTAGIDHGDRRPPRMHDLRHAFAVNTLIGWYRDGTDVNAMMPYLSVYLGHINPSSTYWYLTGSPELARVIAARLDVVAAQGQDAQ